MQSSWNILGFQREYNQSSQLCSAEQQQQKN